MADFKRERSAEALSPFSGARADLGRRADATDTVIIVAAIVLGLYFARDVLVPIAIAVLLSFVLAPVTGAFRRLHVGRVGSVLLAVALAFAILVSLGDDHRQAGRATRRQSPAVPGRHRKEAASGEELRPQREIRGEGRGRA